MPVKVNACPRCNGALDIHTMPPYHEVRCLNCGWGESVLLPPKDRSVRVLNDHEKNVEMHMENITRAQMYYSLMGRGWKRKTIADEYHISEKKLMRQLSAYSTSIASLRDMWKATGDQSITDKLRDVGLNI